MKLPLQQLTRHLSTGQLAPCYLIASDELLLQQDAGDLLRQHARRHGFTERTRIVIDNEWGKTLHTCARSLSLFSEKRLLELDLRGVKNTVTNLRFLQAHAENPPADTVLFIFTDRLDNKTEQTAWFRAIEKKGVVMTIWPVTREQLPQWILQRANIHQLALTRDDAHFLAEYTEGNLLAANQALEKLALWCHDATNNSVEATSAALRDMLERNTRFDIFQLADTVLVGDSQRALRILESLLLTGTEPILILWALTRELRLVARCLHDYTKGATLATIFNTLFIREKRKPLLHASIKRHTPQSCQTLLCQAAKIDQIIKGAARGNANDHLKMLVLGMTQNAWSQ